MKRLEALKLALAMTLGALAVLALPAAATARDRNHDRIPDRWEKRHHLSLKVNQAHRDQDRDRLDNRDEFLAGDNPRDADSDGDGIPDGEENAGTIQSFDAASGRLVISLFGGDTISGLVTESTEIECDAEHGASASDSHQGDDESGEDEHGDRGEPGEEEPGDDHGEEAGGDEQRGEDAGSCTTADLVMGAIVSEAELKLEEGSASFEKVELAG
jgi:hypothetical protein